jgi:hypothetical protein
MIGCSLFPPSQIAVYDISLGIENSVLKKPDHMASADRRRQYNVPIGFPGS